MDNPFGITKEEVLNLCATRLIARVDEEINETVLSLVQTHIRGVVERQTQEAVSKALDAEIQRILESKITPVDMWGEPTGEATTIRDQLHKRAVNFLSEKVDKDGKPMPYGGAPRYQRIYAELANTAFSKAVSENIETIAAAVKKSVRDTIWRDLDTALNNTFKVKINEVTK